MRYGQRHWLLTLCLLLSGGLVLSVAFAQSEAADLAIQSRAEAAVIPVNSNLTTTVAVENVGPGDASFVSLTAVLPPELVFLSSEDNCTVDAQTITCIVGKLAAGESVQLRYQVRVVAPGTGLTYTVSVTGAEHDPDPDNNTAFLALDVVIPEAVDLVLAGTLDPSQVDLSDLVTLSWVVDNPDSVPTYLTAIDLVLPEAVVFESSDDCHAENAIVHCTVGTVAAEGSVTITLTVRAVTPGNPVTITALVAHAADDPDLSNNGVSLNLIVTEPPLDSADLQLSLIPAATDWRVGEPGDLSLTVVNRGPASATMVVVEVELPEALLFVASSDCQIVDTLIRCDIGELPRDAVWTGAVTLIAIAPAEALTVVGRVVGTEMDPNLINNVASVTLPALDAPTPTAVIVTATLTATPPVTPTETATLTPTPLLIPTVIATQTPVEVIVTQPVFITKLPATPASDGTGSSSGNGPGGSSSGADPLPDGVAPSELYGWTRHESVDLIQVTGRWALRTMRDASDGAYHEARDAGALLRFPFEGDGFRVGYRSEVNGASFQILLDGEFLALYGTNYAAIDPELDPVRQTFVSGPHWVTPGYHVVDLICLAAGDGSAGCNVDYIEVFRGPPIPVAPTVVAVPSAAVEVANVELVAAPPTLAPTASPQPEAVISVDVLVSVDLNTNGQVDANEGVVGLTVRAVDVSNNTLLATAVTDESGFVRVRVASREDVVLLIPVLGESYYLRNRGQRVDETWTLLLDPATVPGLIP